VRDGRFREDLFHRLNVIRIHIPPLRKRREDIPLLVRHFLNSSATELKVEPKTVDGETMDFLAAQDWPGNVRQLENTCRWLTVMAAGQTVHVSDLPPELRRQPASNGAAEWEGALRRTVEQRLARGESALLDTVGAQFERIMIQEALKHTGGHKQEAAKRLGWGRNTLTRKLKELQIEA
jgi:two-component system nitrogen regulation response regulator GlnG